METARGPQLPPEALLDVLDWLQVAVEYLPEEGDVGDGQPQGVDVGEPLLIGEGGQWARVSLVLQMQSLYLNS